jgi:hypothetical protein
LGPVRPYRVASDGYALSYIGVKWQGGRLGGPSTAVEGFGGWTLPLLPTPHPDR